MPWRRAYIGLGANIGPRLQNLQAAVDHLAAHPEIRLLTCSHIYETEPVGMESSHWFLNAVAEITTSLEPRALIRVLLNIEKAFGRDRSRMDRTVDLDILYMEGVQIEEPGLAIPHPRLYERAFVLAPWAELAPDLMLLPWKRTVSELLSRLGSGGPEIRATGDILCGDRA